MKLTPGLYGAMIGVISAPPLSFFCWSMYILSQSMRSFGTSSSAMPADPLILVFYILTYIVLFALIGVWAGDIGSKQTNYWKAAFWGMGIGILAVGVLTLLLFWRETSLFTSAFWNLWFYTLFLPATLASILSALGTFLHKQK